DGPMPGLLVAAFRRAGIAAEMTEMGSAPYLPLPSTWDDYLAALHRKYRHLVRQTMRQFEEWSGAPGKLERVTSSADLERGKDILVALHRQRWEGAEQSGVFRSPLFLAFHDTIMRRLFDHGAIELAWLSAHGRPVAAMYNFVWDRKVYFYQCGRA